MQAILLSLAFALAAQTGDRYPGTNLPPAAAPASEAAAESAADADADAERAAETSEAAAPVSPIVIHAETPQPTLVGTEPTAADVPAPSEIGAPPANPRDQAAPLSSAGDSQANGAAAESPSAPETSVLARGPKPADLMRSLLQPPLADQLPGTPLTLGAAVRGAVQRPAQTERARAYWALSAAVAHYYLALQERTELAAMREGVAAPSAAWDDARRDVEARIKQTRKVAETAQLQLHRLMGAAANGSLPLPADAPHCGRYNTRFDEIFTAGADPMARQLNDLLPLVYAEMAAETRQVAEAHDFVTLVAEHRDPANDGTGLLRAYELMSVRRRAFIDLARQYNDQIAEYAGLAAPPQVEADRLVAMLIRVSNPGAAAAPAAGVQQASAAEDPADSTGQDNIAQDNAANSGGGRRTFFEGRKMEVRRPLARLFNRERSIIVRRGLLHRGDEK